MEYTNAVEVLTPKKSWLHQKISLSRDFQQLAFETVNELVIKQVRGKCVTLVDGTELTEFVSCSYLGLDQDPRLISALSRNADTLGITFSAARTRMLTKSFIELDALLSQIFCNAHPVVFSTLHLAHLGVIPMLGSGELPSFPMKKQGPVFILDKTVHSSIQINRALMQQFGETLMLDIQDSEALDTLLKQCASSEKTPIIISDSIGSMGGVAPIKHLMAQAELYQGYVYLDDAHGTSIHGENGAGYVLKTLGHVFHPRLILASTFAKAFGSVCSAVLFPTQKDAEMIKRFSPTYMFGGPPILSAIEVAIASSHIHLSPEISILQKKLWDNVAYFDALAIQNIVSQEKSTPIRYVLIGSELKTIAISRQLQDLGFALTTAMHPVVKKDHGLLRITISATHTREQLAALAQALQTVLSTKICN